MASMSKSLLSSPLDSSSLIFSSSPLSRRTLRFLCNSDSSSDKSSAVIKSTQFLNRPSGSGSTGFSVSSSSRKLICRAAEYKFPDPIPEFAEAETEKFRTHLVKRLSKKELYGDSVDEVVGICTEIFSTFLHNEYGGPGTLLVIPFIDMADTLDERGLPGAPQAARAAVKWAQDHVDEDWKEWTGTD